VDSLSTAGSTKPPDFELNVRALKKANAAPILATKGVETKQREQEPSGTFSPRLPRKPGKQGKKNAAIRAGPPSTPYT